jgi:cell wall-associated NlpC family hydrolase
VELRVGRWLGDDAANTYELRSGGRLFGPLSRGLTGLVVISEPLGRRRAFYGAGFDVFVWRPTRGFGSYGVAGVSLGLSTDTGPQKLSAQWSVGAGLEWRPVGFALLNVEARYRVEDRGPHGFWATTDSHTGFSWAAGVGVRWGGGHGGSGPRGGAAANAAAVRVPMSAPTTISGPAAGVVQIALDALGTPYRWGGTAENGFDCSGLVQWAYAQRGVQLPRISRDQALVGTAVPPVVDALAPGDILLFAARPGGGVTHVGLYVGERKFIHSGSTGVQLSRLDYSDVSGAYWLPRWVGARRVVP